MASQREKRWKHSCARKFAWIKNLGPQRWSLERTNQGCLSSADQNLQRWRGVTNRAERVWRECGSGTYIYVAYIYMFIYAYIYIYTYYHIIYITVYMYRHMFVFTLTQQKDSTKINGPSFLLKDSELSSDLVGKTDAIGSWMKELHFGGASLKSKSLSRGPILDDTRCPFVFVFRFLVVF